MSHRHKHCCCKDRCCCRPVNRCEDRCDNGCGNGFGNFCGGNNSIWLILLLLGGGSFGGNCGCGRGGFGGFGL